MFNEDKVVKELKRLGTGMVQCLPNGWWSFTYNNWEMLYIPSMQKELYSSLRICIPEFRAADVNRLKILSGAVNVLNKNMRFVKASLLDNGAICINYDHKCCSSDDIPIIVGHMLKVLSFAAEYLRGEMG